MGPGWSVKPTLDGRMLRLYLKFSALMYVQALSATSGELATLDGLPPPTVMLLPRGPPPPWPASLSKRMAPIWKPPGVGGSHDSWQRPKLGLPPPPPPTKQRNAPVLPFQYRLKSGADIKAYPVAAPPPPPPPMDVSPAVRNPHCNEQVTPSLSQPVPWRPLRWLFFQERADELRRMDPFFKVFRICKQLAAFAYFRKQYFVPTVEYFTSHDCGHNRC
jgi:hypothetical protein